MDRARGRTLMGNCHTRKLGVCVSVVILGTFIACMMLAYAAFASPVTEHNTIQQVVFLFRHGDRTPTETYPKDPYINYNWPGGWGALTKKGMRQLYNLGQWIRLKYGAIIGRKFESATTQVRSTFPDRCLMSAQALLAGLFVPDPEDMFVPGLAWTPVPVQTIPRYLDKLTVQAPCPRLTEALEQAVIEEGKRSDAELADYYKELTQHTGENITKILDVEFLYNTLEIEEKYGLELPAWTQKFYNDEMREIAARSLALFTDGDIQKRLRGGPWLKEVLRCMEDPKPKRSYFYSAHDTTIVNEMRTMGFTELLKPDFGAMLILELHLVNNGAQNSQVVKMLYLNNTETENPYPLEIPICKSPCLLENLKQALHKVIPNDWDEECKI